MPADWLFNVSCTFDAQGVCITFISRHNNGIVCDTLKTGFFREEAPLLFLLKKRKKYTAVYALSFLNCAKLHPSVCVTVKNYDELCLDFKPARVNQFDCNKNFTHYLILLLHVFLFLHYSCSIVYIHFFNLSSMIVIGTSGFNFCVISVEFMYFPV